MADLNFYAHRFLEKAGIPSTDRTGLADAKEAAKRGKLLPSEVLHIIAQSEQVLNATPVNAAKLFYSTWTFVHDFDHLFKL